MILLVGRIISIDLSGPRPGAIPRSAVRWIGGLTFGRIPVVAIVHLDVRRRPPPGHFLVLTWLSCRAFFSFHFSLGIAR